jgi:hypothetical protein
MGLTDSGPREHAERRVLVAGGSGSHPCVVSAFRHEQHQRSVVVATTRAPSDAEFIKVTLAVHGIAAAVSASSVVFPSIDFVEGSCVSVGASDADAARRVLNDLGLARDELDTPADEP